MKKRKLSLIKGQSSITDFFKPPTTLPIELNSSDSEEEIVHKKKKKEESSDEEQKYQSSENHNVSEEENEDSNENNSYEKNEKEESSDSEQEYQFSEDNVNEEENVNNSVRINGSTLSFESNQDKIGSEEYCEQQMQNETWLKISVNNLKQKSEAIEKTDDLRKQFWLLKKQWGYIPGTWSISDKKYRCDLCEHEKIVYIFPIVNIKNEKKLNVGSSCIFQFFVFNEEKNELLSKEESREIINDDYEKATGERRNDRKIINSYKL